MERWFHHILCCTALGHSRATASQICRLNHPLPLLWRCILKIGLKMKLSRAVKNMHAGQERSAGLQHQDGPAPTRQSSAESNGLQIMKMLKLQRVENAKDITD